MYGDPINDIFGSITPMVKAIIRTPDRCITHYDNFNYYYDLNKIKGKDVRYLILYFIKNYRITNPSLFNAILLICSKNEKTTKDILSELEPRLHNPNVYGYYKNGIDYVYDRFMKKKNVIQKIIDKIRGA